MENKSGRRKSKRKYKGYITFTVLLYVIGFIFVGYIIYLTSENMKREVEEIKAKFEKIRIKNEIKNLLYLYDTNLDENYLNFSIYITQKFNEESNSKDVLSYIKKNILTKQHPDKKRNKSEEEEAYYFFISNYFNAFRRKEGKKILNEISNIEFNVDFKDEDLKLTLEVKDKIISKPIREW